MGMLAYMKRTTVKLDDEVDARMRHEAARRGLTVSEWVREAVAEHLPARPPAQGGAVRTLRGVGAFDSGRSDISSRFDELLGEIFDERERLRHQPHA